MKMTIGSNEPRAQLKGLKDAQNMQSKKDATVNPSFPASIHVCRSSIKLGNRRKQTNDGVP
jgi:hypothetical protein